VSATEQSPEHRHVRCEAADPQPDREADETKDQGAIG
jgi:hypothetical protein